MPDVHSPEQLEAVTAAIPAPWDADARAEWRTNFPQVVAPLNRLWGSGAHSLGAKKFFGSLNLALRAHAPANHTEWEQSFTSNLLLPSRKFWVKDRPVGEGDTPIYQSLHADFASARGAEALALTAARLMTLAEKQGNPVSAEAAINVAYLRIIDGTWAGWEAEKRLLALLELWLPVVGVKFGCVSVRLATDYEDGVFAVDAVAVDAQGRPVFGFQSKADTSASDHPSLIAEARRNEARNRGFLTTHPTALSVTYVSSTDVGVGVLRKRKVVTRAGVTVHLPAGKPTSRTDVTVAVLDDGTRFGIPASLDVAPVEAHPSAEPVLAAAR